MLSNQQHVLYCLNLLFQPNLITKWRSFDLPQHFPENVQLQMKIEILWLQILMRKKNNKKFD